jgi:hypothetical protein
MTHLRHVPTPAKNGIFEPFIYKNDHFAKTGSGQTYGKLPKMPFFAPKLGREEVAVPVRQRVHLYIYIMKTVATELTMLLYIYTSRD